MAFPVFFRISPAMSKTVNVDLALISVSVADFLWKSSNYLVAVFEVQKGDN